MTTPHWTDAFIALGSNLHEPSCQLDAAIDFFRADSITRVLRVSPYMTSPPMGPVKQPDFINAVILIKTQHTPYSLLALCHAIEEKMGRVRTVRWGPRCIDCDIILFGRTSIDALELSIPHPGLLDRDFVLQPLLSIAPDAVLPNGIKVAEAITHAV